MTNDRVIYFGFSVLFLSTILFVIALIAIQPVNVYFKADINGGFGDITTSADSAFKTPVSITNPLNGNEIDLNQNLQFNTTLNKFNATAHVEGQIEIPAYTLAMAAYTNKQEILNFSAAELIKNP